MNRPLYKEKTNTKEIDVDLDDFCKAMGWTCIDGMLPKKPLQKPRRKWEQDDIDLTDVHKDFTKTNVAKEMSKSVLKGIQTKREVKELSEREAHRQRKVLSYMVYNFTTHRKNYSKVMRLCDTDQNPYLSHPKNLTRPIFNNPLVVSWCFSVRIMNAL